jgi:hypothetical protein
VAVEKVAVTPDWPLIGTAEPESMREKSGPKVDQLTEAGCGKEAREETPSIAEIMDAS